MAEYIERSAAIEAAKHAWAKGLEPSQYIEALPAADVAPVVHGRWAPFRSEAAGDIQYCSCCEIGCTWKPKFCPNCGAKMNIKDGGADHEDD